MNSFNRMVILGGLAAIVMSVATPASAFFHHHRKAACAPACAPACEPVCAPVCEPVCAPAPVCAPVCPPPPVNVDICVVDPCTGCSQTVSVCVPAECACEQPCYAGCRNGFLGRKILTYKWNCGHCVEVVLTKHGRAIVR